MTPTRGVTLGLPPTATHCTQLLLLAELQQSGVSKVPSHNMAALEMVRLKLRKPIEFLDL